MPSVDAGGAAGEAADDAYGGRAASEPGFEEPRPAVDTVEILPTPEVQESEQTLVEARAGWPDEIGAVAIETASLPALAGDGQASTENISAAGESEPGAAGPVERAGYEASHPQHV